MNYSTEQAAKLAQMIFFLITLFKINFGITSDELTQIIGASLFLIATGYGWYKRFKRGDISFGGFRK